MTLNTDQLRTFSLRKSPKVVKDMLTDLIRDIQRFVAAIFSIITTLTSFSAACVTALLNVYEGAAGFIFYIVRWLLEIVHFDYKGSLMWAIGLPRVLPPMQGRNQKIHLASNSIFVENTNEPNFTSHPRNVI